VKIYKKILNRLNDKILILESSKVAHIVLKAINFNYKYFRKIPNWRFRYIVGIIQDVNPLLKIRKISTPNIDVIIPVSSKDLESLDIAVYALRQNLLNPIADLTIVYSDDVGLDRIKHLNCNLVHENDFLSRELREAIQQCCEVSKKGWITQQIIKFQGVLNSKNVGTFVLDADTVLLKPRIPLVTVRDERLIQELNICHEYYKPYQDFCEVLLNFEIDSPIHYVTHFQLMQASILKEIFPNHIQSLCDMLRKIDMKTGRHSLSEYQIYGSYLARKHSSNFRIGKWNNLSCGTFPKFDNHDYTVEERYLTIKKLFVKYDSVSFHSYLRGKI
jgi:hypothetical protein